jgi:hypothetical protein
MASGPVFIFCASGLIFGDTECVGSRLMFCAHGLVFGGTEGVWPRFHVLGARTHFRRYQGRRVPFSCFALPDSFSAGPMASGPVFMFCAHGLVFGGIEGVGPRFHVLRPLTHFRRYRWRRVPFSYFALPDSFFAVPRASHLVFMFSARRHIFGGTEGVGSRFHILRSRTRFRRYRWRRVPFSCFARRTRFRWYRGRRNPFSCFVRRTRFPPYRGRRVPFSCFELSDSFSTVTMASSHVFMFCAPGLIFGGTDGVGSHFHVSRFLTNFRRYRGRRVPISCFACP